MTRSCSFLVPPARFRLRNDESDPSGSPSWTSLWCLLLAGAPPLEDFPKDETAVTPLHDGERGRRVGADDLAISREVTVQFTSSFPGIRRETIHTRNDVRKGISPRIFYP